MPRAEELVVRQRLMDTLDRGAQQPLTLVSAPAGTGKTVAVATWVASGRPAGPVVWIELTSSGVHPEELWSEIIKELRQSGVWIRQKPAAAVRGGHPAVIGELAGEIRAHDDPVTVVLDCDLELSDDTGDALNHLLASSAGRLRLILLSRADPLLPLHRYRLAESVVEVRMADLAFTAAEARELLLRRGIDLSAGVVDSLNHRTRGWAAGLLLAAMSLAGLRDPDGPAREISGAQGPVAEYLLAEVLDAQPPAVRTLLLRTSVPELLQPGLIEVLAGPQGTRALAMLVRGNAFLDEIPTTPGCYRYHPLLRDLLRAQLDYEAPAVAARLRLATAAWYAEHGMLDDAVRFAVAAGAYDVAARYVLDDLGVVAFVEASPGSAVHRALDSIPDDTPGAEAALIRGAIALTRRQFQVCAKNLHSAQEAVDITSPDSQPACASALATLLLLLASMTSPPDVTVRAAQNAESLLERLDSEKLARRPEAVRVIHAARARAYLALGRLTEAAESYARVLQCTDRDDHRDGEYVECLGQLALLAAWRGKLHKAVRLAHEALAFRGEARLPQDGASATAEVALAWVHAETHDLSRTRRHLSNVANCGPDNADRLPPFVRVALAIAQSRMHRARGDMPGARTPLTDVGGDDVPTWLLDQLRVEHARIDVLENRPARAAESLTGVSDPVRAAAELTRAAARLLAGESGESPDHLPRFTATTMPERVDKWLVESLWRSERGDEPRAVEALDHALRLAEPEHLRRPFREAPADVRRLLRPGGRLAARHAWLSGDHVSAYDGRQGGHTVGLGAPDTAGRVEQPVVIEQLTAKETEVLGYLAQLLTTDEIASAMFVSVNTIRTHVRNILRKLSVSRRNEAIRRARELGILTA